MTDRELLALLIVAAGLALAVIFLMIARRRRAELRGDGHLRIDIRKKED